MAGTRDPPLPHLNDGMPGDARQWRAAAGIGTISLR
jgi:hypothetical protein